MPRHGYHGVGGAFLTSEEPEHLAGWYGDLFGLRFEAFGDTWAHTFRDPADPRSWTLLSVMRARSPVPRMPRNEAPEEAYGDQPFLLNLRVSDLDALVAAAGARGVAVEHALEEPGVGRFAWVRDPDGNRVEVWEPAPPATVA